MTLRYRHRHAVGQVPTNVQAITGQTIEEQQNLSLPEAMDKNLGSVSITNGQANPFMPDVSFRGFQGSPTAGGAAGHLGVRRRRARQRGIRRHGELGSDPGRLRVDDQSDTRLQPAVRLEHLGGALSINTKSGKTYPGGSVMLQGGSFGSYEGTADYGGRSGPWDYFVAGTYLHSDGWRDFSSSRIEQVFGKVGYETADFDADLSYTFANNNLQGHADRARCPCSTVNPALAYTYPDITNNLLNGFNLRLSKVLATDKILAGNVYYRGFSQNNFSSNVNG